MGVKEEGDGWRERDGRVGSVVADRDWKMAKREEGRGKREEMHKLDLQREFPMREGEDEGQKSTIGEPRVVAGRVIGLVWAGMQEIT